MDITAQQQICRAGDDLVAWVANYDARGRTHRQFWRDYHVAAGTFDALTNRDDLIEGVMDFVCTVREFPILLGFEPEALAARQDIGDLIIGKHCREGAAA